MRAASCLALSLLFLSSPATASPPVVAVFDIDAPKNKRKLARDLTDYLRVQLSQTRRMTIVDKSEQEAQLKRLVREQKKASYKACVDEACQIPLGKELAANQILKSKLLKVGSVYILQAELIDVATAASVGGASVRTEGSDDALVSAVEKLAAQLVGAKDRPPVEKQTSGPQFSAAVLDMQKILLAHPDGKRAKAKLKAAFDRHQADLSREEKAVQALKKRVEAAKGAEQQRLRKEFEAALSKLQSMFVRLQKELAEREKRSVDAVLSKLDGDKEALARGAGARILFHSADVVYRDPRIDCTANLFAAVDTPACAGLDDVLVATIDFERVMQGTPAGKRAKAALKRDREAKQAYLDGEKKKLEKMDKSHPEFATRVRKLQEAYMKEQQSLQEAEARLVKRLHAQLLPKIQSWAKSRGIAILIDRQRTLHAIASSRCSDDFLGKSNATCRPVSAERVGVADTSDMGAPKDQKQAKAWRKKVRRDVKSIAPRKGFDIVVDKSAVAYVADAAEITEAVKRVRAR